MKQNSKSTIYLKRMQSIAMILFMFFFSSMSYAQSSYGVVENAFAKSTVTRVWLEDPLTWIDYAFDGQDGAFYLRVDGTPVVVAAKLQGREVTDFEILHDSVFFCGNDINGGFVGSFDIANLFAGTDVFTVSRSIFFNQASKIAVYKGVGDTTHLAVIGHSSQGYGISDIKWTLPLFDEWNYSESSETEVFEDVDVTDHYVVAVENKGTPHGSHYMRVFDKYQTPSFLYPPMGQNIYCAHNDSYSKNMVTHIAGDTFAVAALAIRPNNLYGNNILLYNGTTFIGSIFTPLWNYYDSLWCMRDFRYSYSDKFLYLLEDMTRTAQGGIEPMVFQYDYRNPTNLVKAFYTPNDVFLNSIDCTVNTGTLLGSGPHNQTSELYSFQWQLQLELNCLNTEGYKNLNPNPGPDVFPHAFIPTYCGRSTTPIVPIIEYSNYTKLCN